MIISRVDRKYTTDCFSKLSQSYKSLSDGFLNNHSNVSYTTSHTSQLYFYLDRSGEHLIRKSPNHNTSYVFKM